MHQWQMVPGTGATSTVGYGASTTTGTTITAGGTSNTKGSWTSLGTVSIPGEMIVVSAFNLSVAGGFMLDIGIYDGVSAVMPIAEDLYFDGRKSRFSCENYPIPVHVPLGSVLYARLASSTASATLGTAVQIYSNGYLGAPGLLRMVPLTAVGTGQKGVTVDPGGTANTRSRTELVASTSYSVYGLMFTISLNLDIARSTGSTLFSIDVGSSSNEYPVVPDYAFMCSGTLDVNLPTRSPWFPCHIPSGSRISCNAQASFTTAGDRTFDIMVYGLVK